MRRKPAVAGYFYPGQEDVLSEMIRGMTELEKKRKKAISVVSPHAGYVYSGAVAAHGYSALANDGKPDLFVIIGVNHHSYTSDPASIQIEGIWETPLGQAQIDSEIAKIISQNELIFDNAQIHRREHSLELQLPFIQYIYGPSIKIIPIMMSTSNIDTISKIGGSIANALMNKNAVIIASTDFTHFEKAARAREQDQKAIDAIKKISGELLVNTVKDYEISMCGYASTSVALIASKKLGANTVKLLKYASSGDTTGDNESVVGYGSLIISK